MSLKCDGCQKFCELGYVKCENPYSAGLYDYYVPTINNLVINAYINHEGRVINIQPSNTIEGVQKLAQQISNYCTKHKMNAK